MNKRFEKSKHWVKKHREAIANITIIGTGAITLIVLFAKTVNASVENDRQNAIWEQKVKDDYEAWSKTVDWDVEMALLEAMENEELQSEIDRGIRSAIYPHNYI